MSRYWATPERAGLFLAAVALIATVSTTHAEGPDRTSPPKLGPPPSLELPELERFELSNSLPVLLLAKHQVPVVQVNLLIRSGSVSDPEGNAGLAAMTAAMLDEGAGQHDALELSDAIDYLGADLSTWSDHHASGVNLFVPVGKLPEALPLMADVALRPTFSAEELERQRLDRLTELLQSRDEARSIVSVQLDRALFGNDHPYGRFSDEASLRALQVGNLEGFHSLHYRPGNAALIVVGDVDRSMIQAMLEASFGGWEGSAAEREEVVEARQIAGRIVYLVDKPEAAQSEIRVGRIGASRKTEDYYALEVMNTILGGSFTSRLNDNLREDKGYTYGAGSRFLFRPIPGPFVAGAAVQTDATDKALVEILKELEAIDSVSDEEVVRAKNYLALQFPRGFQSVTRIADRLSEVVRYDLPDGYFNGYVSKILAVTKADIERVAEKYIESENLAIVVVGDRSKIDRDVAALKLGRIEELTIDEVLGPAPALTEE